MIDKKLLDLIVCPVCKERVEYRELEQKIYCKKDKLLYPVRSGIPILLVEEAISIEASEEAATTSKGSSFSSETKEVE